LPVCNGERYLDQAINTILAQTFRDLTLVISDNASTDRTQAIAEAYAAKDPRVRYYRYEENRGMTWNFNNVFHLADSEYFVWACYDDLIAPEMIERCVAVLDREPEVAVVCSETMFIDENGAERGPWCDRVELRSPHPHLRLRRYLKNTIMVDSIHGVVRKEVLGKTELLDTYVASDKILMGQITLLGQIRELPERMFFRRIHPQISTMANNEYVFRSYADPKLKGTFSLPRWERFVNYMRRIKGTPLSPYERLLCYREVLMLLFLPKYWFKMALDLIVVAWLQLVSLLSRVFRPRKKAIAGIAKVSDPND